MMVCLPKMIDRIRELEEELKQVRKEQSDMRVTLEAICETLLKGVEREADFHKKVMTRLSMTERTALHADTLAEQMLNSRIWKALQAGGGMVLNAARLAKRAKDDGPKELTAYEKLQRIQLRCDSLPNEPKDPVAGTIEIRGWAVAEDGIEIVEIQIGNSFRANARYGLARPDIAKIFPKIKKSGNSGFITGFDTHELPDGFYQVKICARSCKGLERTIEVPLVINQETGLLSEYNRWIETFEVRQTELIRLQMAGFRYRPKFSVLVPVFRTNIDILAKTIESVRNQSYENWELCLVDDGSEQPGLTYLLQQFAAEDSRIRFASRKVRGGISAASNDALAMAVGDYIALLDHDDLLAEDALYYMTRELQARPKPKLLYSDEDHINEAGQRFSPFFKPDWSPDLILSENYVCHLMVFERSLALEAGGFRTPFDLSQDHDILLRMSALVEQIVHVPRILYHWRTSLVSMERASDTGDRGISSSRAVVEAFTHGRATVEEGRYPGRWRIRYAVPEGTSVSILIPTAGRLEVLDRNLKALVQRAGYENYEIVIVDNSKGDAVLEFVDKWKKKRARLRCFDQRWEPFNYSRINNQAAATCESSLLLFLNDDTEAISDDWLTALVELGARREVGAVGAKLLYPSGLIQHAGVTMGLAGICGHSFKGLEGNAQHYFDFPDLIRNVSGLTAACLLTRAEVFREVGGFDEALFPIAYNDIDLVLKIGAAGYRALYTPHAQLYHYEAYSKSERELHPHPAETLALKNKWKQVIARDPFYNPNLTRIREDWSLGWE